MGHVSKTHIPGIQKLAADLCFDVGISLAWVSASRTMLTYPLSTQTRMLMPKHLLLLYNHAPLSRTLLFSSLSSCTLFLCKVKPSHVFSATALDDALKPEAQVCLWAWGGIGARSTDGKKRQWQLPAPPLHGVARASAAPDLGRGGGCHQCPALVYSFDGLHATSDGHVGVGISDLQRILILSLLASYVSQDLSLNSSGVHWTLCRKSSCH